MYQDDTAFLLKPAMGLLIKRKIWYNQTIIPCKIELHGRKDNDEKLPKYLIISIIIVAVFIGIGYIFRTSPRVKPG